MYPELPRKQRETAILQKYPAVFIIGILVWDPVTKRRHELMLMRIRGGIGKSRTFMYLLRAAHLGEVTVSVWPQQLKDVCEKKNIHVLE